MAEGSKFDDRSTSDEVNQMGSVPGEPGIEAFRIL
jgi:hypothetical protein